MAKKFFSDFLHGGDKALRTLEPIIEKGVGAFAPELIPAYEVAKKGYGIVTNQIDKTLTHHTPESKKSLTVPNTSKIQGTQNILTHHAKKALENVPKNLQKGITQNGLAAAQKLAGISSKSENMSSPTYKVPHEIAKSAIKGVVKNLPAQLGRLKPKDAKELYNEFRTGSKYDKSGNLLTRQPLPFVSHPAGNDVTKQGGMKPGNPGQIKKTYSGYKV